MREIWDNEVLTKKFKDLKSRVKRLERAFKKPKNAQNQRQKHVPEMPRRSTVVKVVLNIQQREILEKIAWILWDKQNRDHETAFIEYAKSLRVVASYVDRRTS